MFKLLTLTFCCLTFSYSLFASTNNESKLNLFKNDTYKGKKITQLSSRMIITKDNQVGIQIKIVTPKFKSSPRCRFSATRKYCKTIFLTEFPTELGFDHATNTIFFGDTACAEVSDRRFFGRKLTFTEDCELRKTKNNGIYQVTLINKSN